jgi:DNA-directed RNA polymerase subunit beta'
MGAEAIKKLLQQIDSKAVEWSSRRSWTIPPARKRPRYSSALKWSRPSAVRQQAGVDGHRRLPVIPPELRPMVQLDGGRFATSAT